MASPKQPLDTEVTRLRSKHDYYDLFVDEWLNYITFYEGGRDLLSKTYIPKHARENDKDYNQRLKRAHYLNYCAVVVDFYTNFIFSDAVERNGGVDNEYYQSFLKDVNKKGDDIVEFMKNVCTNLQIFGMLYVLVDTPSANLADSQAVLSKQQAEDAGINPYWILINPDEILDWITDDFGTFVYVKRKQDDFMLDEDGFKRKIEKYTEWTSDLIKISYIDVTETKNIKLLVERTELKPNPIGTIPIEAVLFKKSKKYKGMGNSFIKDIVYNNREILNITSLIDEFLYRQCFNILVKERESLIPMVGAAEEEIGTSNLWEFPQGGKPPQYISPSSDPGKYLQGERTNIIGEIYRQAVQDLRSDLANGEQSSGFSQAQAFSRTVPFIAARADTLEQLENRLMTLTFKFINKQWKGKVSYKDDYSITNVNDMMTHLLMLFKDLALPSESFAKTELKKLVQMLDGKLPTDEQQQVFSEIEKMDFNEWQDKVIGAAPNNTSPGAQQKNKNTGTMMEVAKEAKASVGSTNKLQ